MPRVLLGQDDDSDSIGPLGEIDIPGFSVDPNLLLMGAGVLVVAWLASRVGSSVSTYSRKRQRRKKRRSELRQMLKDL
jgi:hypothetical protein